MAWGGLNGFGIKNLLLLVLIAVLISVSVSIFNSFFYTSRILNQKAEEIGSLFTEGKGFSDVAKETLNSRRDLAYVKLLDENSTLRQSFGGGSEKGIKEYSISLSDGDMVVMGLKPLGTRQMLFRSLIWSTVIGLLAGAVCIFITSFVYSDQTVYYERLISAMKRVSRGDLTHKLDVEDSMDNLIARVFEGFNQMTDQLRRRGDSGRESLEPGSAFEFGPKLVIQDKKEDANLRTVIAFVAKISEFEELSTKLDAGEVASFLTEYRKAASSIISDYGGVTEALLQDEIVALFNVPDEQDKPELRAVCSAVEVLQILSTMSKQRKIEGKESICGKVGIDIKPLPFYSESGIPQNVKEVISLARGISESAPLWRVLVSQGLYKSVGDHVEAKELSLGKGTYYSIVGVEEGIIQV